MGPTGLVDRPCRPAYQPVLVNLRVGGCRLDGA